MDLPLKELTPTEVVTRVPPTEVVTCVFKGKELKLKEINQERFIIKYTVEKNCQLKKFLKSLKLAYRKGCVYYEFIHKETISEDKELIFMHKVFAITL